MAQISRELGLDPRTVKNYLSMPALQYQKYLDQKKTRTKELDVYEHFVRRLVRMHQLHGFTTG